MFKATELQVCVSRLMMPAVVIKTAILAIPHVDLCSIQYTVNSQLPLVL